MNFTPQPPPRKFGFSNYTGLGSRSISSQAAFVKSRWLYISAGVLALFLFATLVAFFANSKLHQNEATSASSDSFQATNKSKANVAGTSNKSESQELSQADRKTISPFDKTSDPSNPAGFRVLPKASNIIIPGGDPVEVGPWADKPAPGIAQAGEKVAAQVEVEGKRFDLIANEGGNFQRVYVAPKAQIKVTLDYAQTGEKVLLRMVDGGTLGGDMARMLPLNQQGQVQFDVQVSPNAGTHRVVINKDGDIKTLDFWVGAPLALRGDSFTSKK